MTRDQWLTKARDNAELLRGFIRQYHPKSADFRPAKLTITAPNVELVRKEILNMQALNEVEQKGEPVVAFNKLLEDGDIADVSQILDQAWFGVPESTDCWHIPGFRLAVDLMDDPPEDMD